MRLQASHLTYDEDREPRLGSLRDPMYVSTSYGIDRPTNLPRQLAESTTLQAIEKHLDFARRLKYRGVFLPVSKQAMSVHTSLIVHCKAFYFLC